MPAVKNPVRYKSFEEVFVRVGNVRPGRIIPFPAPGTATPADAANPEIVGGRNVELVGGVLVEKVVWWFESVIASRVIWQVAEYLHGKNIGTPAGARGGYVLAPDVVRTPDASVVLWESLDDPEKINEPGRAFLDSRPDLAVEVLNPENTPEEMAIKLDEYAAAGIRLMWYIDPHGKAVDVYPRARRKQMYTIEIDGELDGGKVLPGFRLSMQKLFQWGPPGGWPAKKRTKAKK